MKSRDFCYWLQGFFEITQAGRPECATSHVELSHDQISCIKRHLDMVFKHEIDPGFPDNKELKEIHYGREVHEAHEAVAQVSHDRIRRGLVGDPDAEFNC